MREDLNDQVFFCFYTNGYIALVDFLICADNLSYLCFDKFSINVVLSFSKFGTEFANVRIETFYKIYNN